MCPWRPLPARAWLYSQNSGGDRLGRWRRWTRVVALSSDVAESARRACERARAPGGAARSAVALGWLAAPRSLGLLEALHGRYAPRAGYSMRRRARWARHRQRRGWLRSCQVRCRCSRGRGSRGCCHRRCRRRCRRRCGSSSCCSCRSRVERFESGQNHLCARTHARRYASTVPSCSVFDERRAIVAVSPSNATSQRRQCRCWLNLLGPSGISAPSRRQPANAQTAVAGTHARTHARTASERTSESSADNAALCLAPADPRPCTTQELGRSVDASVRWTRCRTPRRVSC
jgi:hypothetical protein